MSTCRARSSIASLTSSAPGGEIVVARFEGFGLGLSICFDVRFPELYRNLALAGADVIAIPAAFNVITGRAHWDLLVRARAIENHAFVVAAAQVGTTAEGIATYGHSLIVDPWGEVLAEATSDAPEVVTATLDVSEVARRRAQIAVMDFRRPDVYDERPASPIRNVPRSLSSRKFLVKFGDRNGSRSETPARHLVGAALQQFVHRRGNVVAPSELGDLTVQIVGLDVAVPRSTLCHEELPTRRIDPIEW